ncbi:hypothetical protein ACFVTJ_03495 [Agrobacterium sp. NPDC058088]|uniref:hypothetical protein n=1 Tax=Agrobacterium sp. NPDC058088 TaxID=3346335 RepID=UPI0036DF62D5
MPIYLVIRVSIDGDGGDFSRNKAARRKATLIGLTRANGGCRRYGKYGEYYWWHLNILQQQAVAAGFDRIDFYVVDGDFLHAIHCLDALTALIEGPFHRKEFHIGRARLSAGNTAQLWHSCNLGCRMDRLLRVQFQIAFAGRG